MKLILLAFILILIPMISFSQGMKKLVKQMKSENMLVGRYVGFSGTTHKPFIAFETFVKTTTLAEKMKLIQHKSPVIKAYIFWSIILTDRSEARAIYESHKNDRQWVDTQLQGCVPTPYQMNAWMDFILTRTEEEMKVYY